MTLPSVVWTSVRAYFYPYLNLHGPRGAAIRFMNYNTTISAVPITLTLINRICRLVVTSFDTARKYGELLDSLPWTVVIVDEAHKIKNQQAKLTQALYAWKWRDDHPIPPYISKLTDAVNAARASVTSSAPSATPTSTPKTGEHNAKGQEPPADKSKPGAGALAPIRRRTGPVNIALTGTAIQNDYVELWTLLDWCNPGLVGTKAQWKMAVVEPLTRGQAKGSTPEERVKGQVCPLFISDFLENA